MTDDGTGYGTAGPAGDVADGGATTWYAVRCVLASGWASEERNRQVYEERITLWRAASVDEAVRRAEEDARAYAATIEDSPDTYLGLAQAFTLDAAPGDGTEVFSLLRESTLAPEVYLDAFFDTGTERSRTL